MIEIQLCGRAGNQMFQYAVCRTLAERLGCNFWVNPSGWVGFSLFNVSFGKRDGNTTAIYKEGELAYDPRIEQVKDYTTLIGFFQSEKYFDNDKARQWFRITPSNDRDAEAIRSKYPPDKYCYINLRGTDVKFISAQKLKLEYYDLAREKMLSIKPDLKFVVITDDVEYGREYFPDYPVMCNRVRTDFILLNRADYVILANSSFSWWAAWLNLNNVVVAPHGWLNVNINKWEFSPKDIKVERFIWV
jgi:hypothetical protein